MARRLLPAPLMLALAAGAAMALVAGAAVAQDVRQYRSGDTVDPREVAAILGQASAAAPAIKMRSIRLLDDAGAATTAAPVQVAAAAPAGLGEATESRPRPSELSLPVQFAFDSADILPQARHQLDALAAGIQMLAPSNAVVIQGHTDAVGPDHYNEQLSVRRAHAVKRYLVAAHGIEPSRLRAVGMGEYVPLPGRDPYAAENRRVQFRGE